MIHSDGTYDIVYDELIQGNICRENHVSIDRITIIDLMEQDDNYWNDSQNQSTYPQEESLISSNTVGQSLAYSLESNQTVNKICKV